MRNPICTPGLDHLASDMLWQMPSRSVRVELLREAHKGATEWTSIGRDCTKRGPKFQKVPCPVNDKCSARRLEDLSSIFKSFFLWALGPQVPTRPLGSQRLMPEGWTKARTQLQGMLGGLPCFCGTELPSLHGAFNTTVVLNPKCA